MTSPLDAITWPVHTRRLTLRPAVAADAESVWRYRRLEEVARWLTSAPGTFEDFRQHFEDPARLAKTVLVELDGVVVGDLMVAVEDAWAQADVAEQAVGVQAELGWCLAPDHQGRGYASEAVAALLHICFESLGLRRVVANCFADNEASWRLMERLGMRRELYAVRESLHRSGEWLDAMGYALLAEEWREGSTARDAQADAQAGAQASIASASTS
jgi:RimJ/RimL family protein N-acetyltransferase